MEAPDFARVLADIRASYRPGPLQWVLNPYEYDAVKAHVESGHASEDVKRFFAACVRAEPMGG